MNRSVGIVVRLADALQSMGALLLVPALASAGVQYEVAVRHMEAEAQDLAGPAAAPTVTRYFVDHGRVRVGGRNAKSVYLFDDRTLYVIDSAQRSVHVLRHATLSEIAAHYAETVKQLHDAAESAPPGERAAAEQKAAEMQAASERMRQPVPRDYRVTVRFESVDGRACRIWEEWEGEAKRLELCVAPVATVPGGAEILEGMKTLSRFRQGSELALGVAFGLSEWWSDISLLGGVPLLVKEYKYESLVAEFMLTDMHAGVPADNLLSIPDGYHVEDGPDYTQWYVR